MTVVRAIILLNTGIWPTNWNETYYRKHLKRE